MRRCRWKRKSAANGAKNNTAIATTATADAVWNRSGAQRYVGRFAPSPTGDLHLGSLYAAAASYLDARAAGGRWLLRIEDLDRPREVPGSADHILHTLDAYGFEWDGVVTRQSDRTAAYASALADLESQGLTFECSCSRLQLSEEDRYPGTCRMHPQFSRLATATRLRVEPGRIAFTDRIQGMFRQDVAAAVGDIIIRRRDDIIAYVLGVVVDDADQGITHIVRGADLLDNTPRQIYLQRALHVPACRYAHVPVLCESDGAKLAKSKRSVRVTVDAPRDVLLPVFALLGLRPPSELCASSLADCWRWAAQAWDIKRVPQRLALRLDA